MLSFPFDRCSSSMGIKNTQIPYSDFKVSKGMESSTITFVATGVVLVALAVLALTTCHSGVGAYYFASAEIATGVAVIGAAIFFHYRTYDLQTLPLPQAKTVEAYKKMLDLDEGHTYSYAIPEKLQFHTVEDTTEQLAVFKSDFPRAIYRINGTKAESADQIPERARPFLNQELLADVANILLGRYCNTKCDIHVQHARDPFYEAVTNNTNLHLHLGNVFEIMIPETESIAFIKAELWVDMQTGDGKVTWQSPQSTKPTW